jgi:hypothetical protein
MKAILTLSVSILLFQIFTATAQQATTTSRNLNQIKESFYKSLGLSEKDLEEYRIESGRHHEEMKMELMACWHSFIDGNG